jgi:hypothetical protein
MPRNHFSSPISLSLKCDIIAVLNASYDVLSFGWDRTTMLLT